MAPGRVKCAHEIAAWDLSAMRRTLPFAIGLALVVGGLGIAAGLGEDVEPSRQRGPQELPEPPIQGGNLLPTGERVSLAQARQRVSYRLPLPPTDSRTGALTGIWADPSTLQEVAFLWETDLRVYVYRTTRAEAEVVAMYHEKAAREPENWTLTSVRGHPALGANLKGDVEPTSSLFFHEDGLQILVVSPSHTLDQLREIAEDIRYE